MKFFSVLFLLGLFDACLCRSMQPETLKKRFDGAKYAFKFRVDSKSIGECFRSSVATTTSATTESPTTEPTILKKQTRATTEATTASKKRETTAAIAKSSMTLTSNKTTEMPSTSTLTENTSDAPEITTTRNSWSDGTTKKLHTKSSTSFPTTTNPKLFESNRIDSDLLTGKTLGNSSERGTEPPRKKSSCDWIVYHQDILIARKHIFKGCAEINEMKRVGRKNEKYLKSTIRLQMDFSELKGKRNYLFTGRAVPNQNSDDYVFMADELTVLEWKPSPFKLKKYLKSNRGDHCN